MLFRIISCEILEEYLKRDDILLLDLREKKSYDQDHIASAIWVDWEKIEEDIPMLLSTLDYIPAWIILYCEHGNTSLLIARDLARNGYPVISLNGGYAYWIKHQTASPKT